MKLEILLKNIVCDDIEYMETGTRNLSKTLFDDLMDVHTNQIEGLITTNMTVTSTITLATTGERCKIKCISTFELYTDWDILRNPTHETTLLLYGELSLIAFSNIRGFFLEKAKDTNFKNLIIPYKSFTEMIEVTRKVLLSQIN